MAAGFPLKEGFLTLLELSVGVAGAVARLIPAV